MQARAPLYTLRCAPLFSAALFIISGTLFCAGFAPPGAAAGPELGGWLQTGLIASGSPIGAWAGGFSALRLNLTQAEENVTLKASLDFLYRFGSRQLFPDLMAPSEEGLPPRLTWTLRQASLRLDYPSGFLQVGRDNLTLGTSRGFSLFEPFSPTPPWTPGGEKPPVDFWYLQGNLGETNRLAVAQVFAGEASVPLTAARFNRILPQGEYSLIGLSDPARGREVYGLDLFSQWEVGYWLAAAWTRTAPEGEWANQYILGLDYTLPWGNGVYLSAEYFYDGTGGTSLGQYNWSALRDGERATLASRYLGLRQRYNLNDFWQEEVAAYGNLDDRGIIFSPRLIYLCSQDTELALGADLVWADRGTELNPGPTLDPGGLLGQNRYYLAVKKAF